MAQALLAPDEPHVEAGQGRVYTSRGSLSSIALDGIACVGGALLC